MKQQTRKLRESDAFRELTGDFEVEIWERNPNGGPDRLIHYFADRNVIVNNGRAQMARLIGNDTTNRPVTKIGFGVGTAAAVATDTALTTPFIKLITTAVPGTGVTYPVSTSTKFSWTLENAEGNGLNITEFGLYSNDGTTLFARKVRSAIAKTSAIRLVGTWTVNM